MKTTELAPYLPYGLKGIFSDLPGNRVFSVTGLIEDEDNLDNEMLVHGKPGAYGGHSSSLDNFKPILRPLSDLIQPEYVKIIWEDESYLLGPEWTPIEQAKRVIHNKNFIDICFTWNTLEKFFAYHFDIFGLIERGEAIDINTITQ